MNGRNKLRPVRILARVGGLWRWMTATLLLGLALTLGAAPQGRPNILWLTSEDNGPFLGCYGDELASTPTLDRLAKDGILFERCFAQPVCAPSRFTLITGLYAASCGPAEHMRAQGKGPSNLKGFPAFLREAGYYTSNNSKTDYNAPLPLAEIWNESSRQAHWSKRPDAPFFSVFNHEVTHESCLFPEAPASVPSSRTDPAKVRVPPYQPDTPEMRADWARYYDQMALLDTQIARKLKDLEQAGLADDTIVFYFADNGGVLPRSKRFLQRSGTHVPLIAYFPPKWRHLAPAKPGSRIQDPVSFVDFAPTVLSLAGVKIPGYMQGRAFAGSAKAEPNEFVFSTRDRMDERYDMIRSVIDRRWLYIRNFRPDLPYVPFLQYMFQARGYQSWARAIQLEKIEPAATAFWGEKPGEELYDLAADPDNVRNLASDPAFREQRDRMRAALRDWTLLIRDNGFIPEGSVMEGYEASRQPGVYPVDRVFSLANAAADRKQSNLQRFIEALGDPNEAVRWWAAQGCAMLGAKAAPAEMVLTSRLDDASGSVRVAVAEALAHLEKTQLALPVLEQCLNISPSADQPPGNGAIALQAANVLDRLGEAARPVLPAMKRTFAATGSVSRENSFSYLHRSLDRSIAVLEGRASPLPSAPSLTPGASLE